MFIHSLYLFLEPVKWYNTDSTVCVLLTSTSGIAREGIITTVSPLLTSILI